jgi:Ca2+-binding EF-hand superfamily protein
MHNNSNWSVGHGVSPQHDSEVKKEIRRQQYVNQAGRYRTHAEHDVFHSSVGLNQHAPTGIVDISGERLQSFGRADNPRYETERQFISDKAQKSMVPEKDRTLVNAIRQCANKLLHIHSNPHGIFSHYDRNNSRHLNFDQFQQALRYVGCDVGLQGARLLFNHYGVQNQQNGSDISTINYDFFIAAMKEHGNDDKGTTLVLPDHSTRVHKLRTGYSVSQHHDHFDVIKSSPSRNDVQRQNTYMSPRNTSIKSMMKQHDESIARTLSPIRDANSIDRRFVSKEEQQYLLLKSRIVDMIRGANRGKMMHTFAKFDRSQTGLINVDNFLLVLHEVGIRMSRNDGEKMFKDFRAEQSSNHGTHLLKYQDFTNAVMVDDVQPQTNISRFSINEKQGELTQNQARRYIIQQRVFDILKDRKEFLARSLFQLDTSNFGLVDFSTFWKAMKMASIILSDADARRVFDRFDATSGGKIMYEQITKMLGCKTVNNGVNGKFNGNDRHRGSSIPDPAKHTDLERDKNIRVVKQRVIDKVALVAPKLYQAFQFVPQKEYGNKTLIGLSAFANCIRTAGIVLSENDTIALFNSVRGPDTSVSTIDYMQFLNMLDSQSSLKRREDEPPVYIEPDATEYDNILSSGGYILGKQSGGYNNKDFGIGLVPTETDNTSRTGNLMVEQVLLRIIKQCDMNSNLLERAFIGLTGAFGELTKQDFLNAMNRLGVRLNHQETNALFKKLNPGKPTVLDLNDFLRFVRVEYGKWQR